MDSQLIVYQIKNKYKVSKKLEKYYIKALNLLEDFD